MTTDNASGAGMELPPLPDFDESTDFRVIWDLIPQWKEADAGDDSWRVAKKIDAAIGAAMIGFASIALAESQAHNAKLEAQVERMRQALQACAAVCSGQTMDKNGLINALELARAALKP